MADDDLTEQVTCWVCFEIMEDPTTLFCNHSFCKDCLIKVYKRDPNCPFCRRPFGLPLPDPDQDLLALIERLNGPKPSDPAIEPAPLIEQDSILLDLPLEVTCHILDYLPPAHLSNAGLVCHTMHTLAEDPWVWHSLCKDKFPFIGGGIEGTDWKKTYFKRSKLQRGWDGGKAGDFTVTSMRGHDGYITKVGLVKNIAFTGGSTGQVKAWRANTSKLSFECTGHTSAITALEIFDTSILTASLDSTVKLWDLQTGVQVRDMRVGSGVTYAAASSSSSKQGLFATTSGLCHLYDLRDATRTSVQTGYHAEVRGVVALEGDAGVGTKFAIARTNGLYLHDTTAPNNLDNALNSLVQPHSIEFLQVAGSDLLAASSGSNILLWNWKTGQTVWTLPLPIALNSITAMKADSTHILAGTSDGTVFVIRHRNPQVVKINAHPGSRVNDIQFDQHRIVTAGGDNSIKVWDKSGSPVYTLLGGSLQIRGSALPHPTKPGCSSLFYDDNRIVASFANVLKSFNFSVE